MVRVTERVAKFISKQTRSGTFATTGQTDCVKIGNCVTVASSDHLKRKYIVVVVIIIINKLTPRSIVLTDELTVA
jgi:hypothetical protein